jgi:endogenous inhibitor of DNA gyrase (YacG/DUF329 family)
MFLVIGVSPKTKIIDQNPRPCPACGSAQAFLKRIDHYFNLFFIPLFKVKQGEPFLACSRCEKSAKVFSGYDNRNDEPSIHCRTCGKPLQQEFRYCPFCGKQT